LADVEGVNPVVVLDVSVVLAHCQQPLEQRLFCEKRRDKLKLEKIVWQSSELVFCSFF
jgi:hypothetical protein